MALRNGAPVVVDFPLRSTDQLTVLWRTENQAN